MPGRKKSKHVTIMDVARACGFSASTVSIVLNDAPLSRYVAATTKALVRKTAAEMGYHPDASARSLRSRRSQTIGVILFDLSDPFCTLILRGIELELNSSAYVAIIMDARSDRRLYEGYLRMLVERRVEGVIIVANWLFEEGGLLADLKKIQVPMVVVGRDMMDEQISSVIVDNEIGGYMAMKHLHSLGHTSIAVIRGPESLVDSSRRWEGMSRFAKEHDVLLDPRRVLQLPEAYDPAAGFRGGATLTRELLENKRQFSALIAFDDLTALGALRTLSLAGLRVPGDCSIVGFDDIPAASYATPSITTIRQPMEEMGRLSADCILRAMQESDTGQATPPMMQLLAPSVVIRESTLGTAELPSTAD